LKHCWCVALYSATHCIAHSRNPAGRLIMPKELNVLNANFSSLTSDFGCYFSWGSIGYWSGLITEGRVFTSHQNLYRCRVSMNKVPIAIPLYSQSTPRSRGTSLCYSDGPGSCSRESDTRTRRLPMQCHEAVFARVTSHQLNTTLYSCSWGGKY
jgi:hypothetical protein